MGIKYDGNFYLAAMPRPMLKDYCHGCMHIELEAVGVQMYDNKITVPMLYCRFRGACEQQRRMIKYEEQRDAYERARFEDERRASAKAAGQAENADVL
jgi:hypothetical protein